MGAVAPAHRQLRPSAAGDHLGAPRVDAEHPEHPAEAEHPEREIVPAEASP
ncbi:MAG: hypothetical protein R2699_00690 [Acidimicrobiales bacterium]